MTTLPLSPHSWQSLIHQRLRERDARERAHDDVVDDYRRLLQHAKLLQTRSQGLLRAASEVAPATAPTVEASSGTSTTPTPVQTAYVLSLESQISSLQEQMATLYKTQAQNAQRLLSLTDQLQANETSARADQEALRTAGEERDRLRRARDDALASLGEKDRMIQMLQDELSALSLELNQIEARNDALKQDNASLLQRWLDRMNDEADRMNLAMDEETTEHARKRAEGKVEGGGSQASAASQATP